MNTFVKILLIALSAPVIALLAILLLPMWAMRYVYYVIEADDRDSAPFAILAFLGGAGLSIAWWIFLYYIVVSLFS